MEEAKNITISISNIAFNIDLDLEDEELIEIIFIALRVYVKKGSSINVKTSHVTSLSHSLKMVSRLISNTEQMDKWRAETKRMISMIRKAPIH